MLDHQKTISSDDLFHIVQDMHHSPEDFHEGNIDERINAYDSYALEKLVLADINLDEWNLDALMVQEYAQNIKNGQVAPPIVYDPVEESIIDGAHRANAAYLAGQTFIMAYVGLGERRDDFVDDCEDDCEDEDNEECEDDCDDCENDDCTCFDDTRP